MTKHVLNDADSVALNDVRRRWRQLDGAMVQKLNTHRLKTSKTPSRCLKLRITPHSNLKPVPSQPSTHNPLRPHLQSVGATGKFARVSFSLRHNFIDESFSQQILVTSASSCFFLFIKSSKFAFSLKA
jgi:hypothetical protein